MSKIESGKIIPILAMTANAFVDDIQKSRDAGMDAHLSKPVDIAMLESTIRKYRVTTQNIDGVQRLCRQNTQKGARFQRIGNGLLLFL